MPFYERRPKDGVNGQKISLILVAIFALQYIGLLKRIVVLFKGCRKHRFYRVFEKCSWRPLLSFLVRILLFIM